MNDQTPNLKIARDDAPTARRSGPPVWPLLMLGALLVGVAVAMYMTRKPPHDAVGWLTSFDDAASKALADNKLILLDFSADWCPPCRVMDEAVFSSPTVGEAVRAGFVPVRIDVTRPSSGAGDLAGYFGIEGTPTLIALDRGGKEIARHVGGLNQYQFLSWLADVQRRTASAADSSP